MWLINCETLQLDDFGEADCPPYAILSHTWGKRNEEVSFQDMQKGIGHDKPGYEKILQCAIKAREHDLEWCWVDTCCIDKSSSAELSEAINSMFRWYKQSAACFAYLIDYDCGDDTSESKVLSHAIEGCRWFTRGWTLQELIAPSEVEFFDKDWFFIGKRSKDPNQVISNITKISVDVLSGARRLQEVSVAAKMAWAASRQTSRTEDLAYCLLGIFDINMPLIYGEGDKAFRRLQEEILKSTDDLSIFGSDQSTQDQPYWTVLASSPRSFKGMEGIEHVRVDRVPQPVTIFQSYIRLSMSFMFQHLSQDREPRLLGLLDCGDGHGNYLLALPFIVADMFLENGERLWRAREPVIRVSRHEYEKIEEFYRKTISETVIIHQGDRTQESTSRIMSLPWHTLLSQTQHHALLKRRHSFIVTFNKDFQVGTEYYGLRSQQLPYRRGDINVQKCRREQAITFRAGHRVKPSMPNNIFWLTVKNKTTQVFLIECVYIKKGQSGLLDGNFILCRTWRSDFHHTRSSADLECTLLGETEGHLTREGDVLQVKARGSACDISVEITRYKHVQYAPENIMRIYRD